MNLARRARAGQRHLLRRDRERVGTYGDPAHPHAVTEAATSHYGYDAVGNQIARPGVKVTYTSFDLPKTIEAAKAKRTTSFGYDGDEKRVKKTVTEPAGTTATTYFGDLYERESPPNGADEHRYHIHAAGREVATVTPAEAHPPGVDDPLIPQLTHSPGSAYHDPP